MRLKFDVNSILNTPDEIYRNVLVTGDCDERIYEFIDMIKKKEKNLFAVYWHGGHVKIWWWRYIPGRYKVEYLNLQFKESWDCWVVENVVVDAPNFKRVISARMRYQILSEQNWRCNICGVKLKYGKKSEFGDEISHIDHIHPFSKMETYRNGAWNINERENLQALCKECNMIKWNKEVN